MTTREDGLPSVELKPGDLYTASEPTIITTLLGSCISVCLYSPVHKAGGMCHAVLPSPGPKSSGEDARFVDCAVRMLVSALQRMGVPMTLVEAKIFGGADMFTSPIKTPSNAYHMVGRNNIMAARRALESNRIRLVSECVGGGVGRRIIFNTSTGLVLLKQVGASQVQVRQARLATGRG